MPKKGRNTLTVLHVVAVVAIMAGWSALGPSALARPEWRSGTPHALTVASRVVPLLARSVAQQFPPRNVDACLPADFYWAIAVGKGESVAIRAEVLGSCDTRGWSTDNWGTRSGPAGLPSPEQPRI